MAWNQLVYQLSAWASCTFNITCSYVPLGMIISTFFNRIKFSISNRTDYFITIYFVTNNLSNKAVWRWCFCLFLSRKWVMNFSTARDSTHLLERKGPCVTRGKLQVLFYIMYIQETLTTITAVTSNEVTNNTWDLWQTIASFQQGSSVVDFRGYGNDDVRSPLEYTVCRHTVQGTDPLIIYSQINSIEILDITSFLPIFEGQWTVSSSLWICYFSGISIFILSVETT